MADLSQLKLPNNQTYNIKDSAAVKAVTWDTTNKKITKTINGTTTDVVTGATILDGMTSTQVTTALGYTPPDQPTKFTSGAVATFEAANLPMPKLVVSIEPQQSGSGDPSPENVRPISGWTACNVVRTGKNLFDVANTATIYPKLKQGQTIYAKQNSSNDFGLYVLYEGDSQSTALQLNSNTKASMVLTKDVVQIAISDNARNALISQGKDIMVSTTDFTDIDPYNGDTYTINFVDGSSPLTVYGGTLDVLSGVLTDVVRNGIIDIGAQTFAYNSTSKTFYLRLFNSKEYTTSEVANAISSAFKCVANSAMSDLTLDNCFSIHKEAGSVWLNIRCLAYSDATNFANAMSGQTLMYEVSSPTTYQLTPTEVKSLLGVNNIFADTGNVLNAEYVTKEYNNLVVGSAEKASVADKLGTADKGSATNPIYLDDGIPKACTYGLNKTVPSNADFTNTWRPVQDNLTSTSSTDSLSAKQGKVLNDNLLSYQEISNVSIATFDSSDGIPMTDLVVSIEPQQDLHGYDAPWVGGAGKNKCPVEKLADGNSNNFTLSAGSYTFSFRLLGSAKYSTSSIILYDSSNNEICAVRVYGVSVNSYMDAQFTLSESKTLHIANSNVIVGSGGYAIDNVQIENGGSRTTFAPYSNECPISGWSAVDVTKTGKNLCKSTIHGYVSSTDDLIVIDNDTESAIFYAHEGQTYTISSSATMNKSRVALVGTDNVVNYTPILQREILSDNVNTWTATWTGWTVWYKCSSRQTAFDNSAQIELGNQATTYETYNGDTYTINFVDGSNPLTVYGGTLDVVNGVLTVDRVLANLGNCAWTYQATNKVFYTTSISDYLFNSSISAICSQYGYIGTVGGGTASLRDDEYNGKCAFYYLSTGVSREFYIKDLAYDDASAFKTAMNGVQLVYELATPQTYQLTPTEVKSLLGVNNICADTGDILELSYQPNNIIGELRGEIVEAGTTVTQSIAGSDNYNILMSGSNDNYGSTTLTETVKKATSLKYNNGGSMLILENGDFNISLCVGGLSNISVGKQKVITGTSNKYKHYIDYTSDDITMHTNNSSYPNTWDGTNTSLKTAVTNAGSTVSQNNTIKDEFLPILFSYTGGVTSKTEEAAINTNFKYNPSLEALTVGSRLSGTTTGTNSVSIGTTNTASASHSYAEGYLVVASGQYSHAEGYYSTASGKYSHAECNHTTASGQSSHAEGDHTTASGQYSHAEGIYTTAQRKSQHVFGEYNVLDTTGADGTVRGSYVEIVGKGTGSNTRSNARTLDWSGNEWIAGTYSNGSSRKLKTNIESLSDSEALKVLELNPVKFDFISAETNDQRERGFIAEEVMDVIPQVAFEEETDEEGNITKPASLNYIGLIPYLVKMIQIQQKEIDELKNK